MDYIYKNIQEYNPNKKRKILTFFDDVITDMLSNKKLNPIVTESFVKGRKRNISPTKHFLQDLILMCKKILDWILCTILPWKLKKKREHQKIGLN